jgi:hypothetical protein
MSTEWSGTIHLNTDMSHLNSTIREHIIVYPPPWSFDTLLQKFITHSGRKIKIIIYHNSRNFSIVESSISHHVLQTTVEAFQNHRLSNSVSNPMYMNHPSLSSSSSATSSRRRRINTTKGNTTRAYDTVGDAVFFESTPISSISSSSPTVSSNHTCTICLTRISFNELEILPCAHQYHRRCIHQWMQQKSTCPVCRTSII